MEAIWKDEGGNPVEVGDAHRIIYGFLDKARAANIKALILAPRGLGKTETLLGYLLRILTIDPKLRVSIISDNDEHAKDRVAAVRHYIEKDPDYRELFPEIQLDRSKRGRRTLAKFRLAQNRYAKDSSLEAAGVLSSGTGNRADVQAYDDLCTEKNTLLEPMSRERVKKVFFKTWLNILSSGGWAFYIGTLYHEEDLTHALLGNPRWAVLRIGLSEDFSCYDAEEFWPDETKAPQGETERKEWREARTRRFTIPLWTPAWSEDRYRERYEEMLASGDANAFLASYRNLLIDPDTATFRPEWFNIPPEIAKDVYSHESKPGWYKHRVLYADPATARKKESCFYAGVVLGWDGILERMVVLDAWRAKERLSYRVDRYLDAFEQFFPHDAAVEGQHDESFAERIEERAVERAVGLHHLRRHTHGQDDKIARISGLGPLVQAHKVVVDTERFPWFRKEAEVFPNGKMDGLDALQGAVHFMQKWLKARGYVPRRLHLREQRPGATLAQTTRFFPTPPPRTPQPMTPANAFDPRAPAGMFR